jgi:GNAT superfamily N-acetyltransferase
MLDEELKIRDGADHDFYNQFNGIEDISYALVIYQSGNPVGCGAIKKFDNETLEVKRMYVIPKFRGRGIAGKILKSLEQWALEIGYRKLILETGLKQPEAIALYEKSGFSSIENYGPYVGIANSRCFEKQL